MCLPTLSSFILILWHLSYSRTIRCAYIYRTKVDIRAAFVCVFKRDARARSLAALVALAYICPRVHDMLM